MTLPTFARSLWKHWLFLQKKHWNSPKLIACDFLNILPGPPADILTLIPSISQTKEQVNIKTSVFDKNANPTKNAGVRHYFENSYINDNTFKSTKSGIIRIKTEDKELKYFSNPSLCSENQQKYKIFWGEIHGHTVFSDGSDRTPNDYFQWARDIAGLDFSAITDHDFGIAMHNPRKNWETILDSVRNNYNDHRFVTFPAWEVSHAGLANGNALYGHKNFYFMDDDIPFYNSSPYGLERVKIDYNEIEELIELLEKHNIRFLIADHTSHMLTDWNRIVPEYTRLVEVCSFFGISEWIDTQNLVANIKSEKTSRQGLNLGHKLGFTGGTDTHCAAPANMYEPNPGFTASGSDRTPGLTAVWAKELTREAIFDALWNRRTYAVRGSRILVKFEINGHIMGSELKLKSPQQTRDISILTAGTGELDKVELICNNEIIKKWEFDCQWEFETLFQHNEPLNGLPLSPQTNYYYVRVTQKNGHMAWSSPIWLSYEN